MTTTFEPVGIVEGFYGRAWSWQQRRDYAQFLSSAGLNTYLYAPKSDAFLRKAWHQDWPKTESVALESVARDYTDRGLCWGMGLSPYRLYEAYGATERRALKNKVHRLDALGTGLLAILFDDMPGSIDDLAERQAEIIADVESWSAAQRILVCPTYYSLDPVLQEHFGSMPEGYWNALGCQLPASVGVFWTGENVCSKTVTSRHMVQVADMLGRKPVLWDNYPVNDGAAMVDYLHLAPLSGRDSAMTQHTSGHLCNPMNQACLSRYPLGGLAALYGGATATLEELYGAELATLLRRDSERFQYQGRASFSDIERQALMEEYVRCDNPAAREVVDWLHGDYAFDPDCLTG